MQAINLQRRAFRGLKTPNVQTPSLATGMVYISMRVIGLCLGVMLYLFTGTSAVDSPNSVICKYLRTVCADFCTIVLL